jgi:putative ABC transport system substrate-binding protein
LRRRPAGQALPHRCSSPRRRAIRDAQRHARWAQRTWPGGRQAIHLAIKDVKGDAAAAEQAATTFEKDNVTLIYALTSSDHRRGESRHDQVPIVFAIGSDPVTGKLVDSFAKPGGRLTGVHYLVRDLTAKRLEVLKEILPKVSRVLTFYDPTSRVAAEATTLARDEAKRIGIKLIERHVNSVDELKSACRNQDR